VRYLPLLAVALCMILLQSCADNNSIGPDAPGTSTPDGTCTCVYQDTTGNGVATGVTPQSCEQLHGRCR